MVLTAAGLPTNTVPQNARISIALSAPTLPITVPMSTPTSTERPLLGYLLDSHLHSPTSSTSITQEVRSPIQRSHALCPMLRIWPVIVTQLIQQPGRNTCALLLQCSRLIIPGRLTSPLGWTGCMVRSTMNRLPGRVHHLFPVMIKSKSVRLHREP